MPAALAACVPGNQSGAGQPPASQGPVVLEYWRNYGTEHQLARANQAAIDDYVAKHPGRVTINIGDGGGPANVRITPLVKIQTLVAGGTPPDLWQTDHISSAQVYSLGALVDMHAALRTNKEWARLKSEMAQAPMEAGTWMGRLTLLPVVYDPNAMAFNKRHLASASVPLPPLRYTWNDFLEIGRRAARPDERWLFFFQYNALRFGFWWRVNGQRPFNADKTKVLIDTQPMRETLEWCHDQVTRTQLAKNGTTNFNAGEAITDHCNASAVTVPQYPDLDPGDGSGIFVTHYPLGPSNTRREPAISGNAFGFSIFKAAGDQKVTAAAELAAWSVRPEVQAKVSDASNLFPAHSGASKHPAFPRRFLENPILKALTDLVPYGVPEPNFPSWGPPRRS